MDDEIWKYHCISGTKCHMAICIFEDNTYPHGYVNMKMCWKNMVASV
jgi:hypothetical protein